MLPNPKIHPPTIIFALDDTSLRGLYLFTRAMDQHRAMGQLKGLVTPCIGMYKGVAEHSFLMRQDDFKEHVAGKGFCDKQDIFLTITPDMVAHFREGGVEGNVKGRGKQMFETTNPSNEDGWTYVTNLNKYFTVEK